MAAPNPPTVRPAVEQLSGVDMWSNRVASSGDNVAFRHLAEGAWRTTTYRDADAAGREVAAGLVALGIAPGDAVAILSQTRLEWALADLGILFAGAVTVPIYPSSTAEQTAFIMKDSGAKAVVAEDAAQLEKLLPFVRQQPGLLLVHIDGDARLDKTDARGRTQVTLAEVLVAYGPAGAAKAPVSFTTLRESGRAWAAAHAGEIDRRARAVTPGDVFTIIYTSGTTGNPKGVVLTHGNLTSAVTSACRALKIEATDEQLLFLPLAHVLARELLWAVLHMGATTAFAESIGKLKENLVAVRPTFMAGVPRVFEKFYSAVQTGAKVGSPIKVRLVAWAFGVGKRAAAEGRAAGRPGPPDSGLQLALADKLVLSKLRAKLGLDRCRFLISGGAPLAAEIGEFFHGVGLLVLEGYGLTETMAAAFLNRVERFRFGTVGPVLDVVEHKIADDGEILMRGPSVFGRYHGNPAATAEAIDADGWFHSGDIGALEDGFLRITDRKKDLIVTAGGKKIAPQLLENTLKSRCPSVSQVMVYGDKRPYCVALVTLTEDAVKHFGAGDSARAAASPQARSAIGAAIETMNGTFASYESIKNFAILPADFTEAGGELTPSLKIKRKIVTDRHRQVIDGLYAQAAA